MSNTVEKEYCEAKFVHYMEKNNISCADIAKIEGCSRQNVYNKLHRAGVMSERNINWYANLFGLEVELVFRDKTTHEIVDL